MSPTIDDAMRLHQAGRLTEADAVYRMVLQGEPHNAQAIHWLGLLLLQRGAANEGLRLLRRSIELAPDTTDFYCNLAASLGALGQDVQALSSLQTAIHLHPETPRVWHCAGVALEHLGRLEEALRSYDRAISLGSDEAELHTHRGNVLWRLGRAIEAETAHRRAISLKPQGTEIYNNLARVLGDQGRSTEALECYKRAFSFSSASAATGSNLILTMHYVSGFSPQELFLAVRDWSERYAEPLTKAVQSHPNNRNPDRQLRIGYVSSEFRENPVGWLLEPILAARNRRDFEIYCYAYELSIDKQTAKLKAVVDVWRSMAGLSDDAVAEQIRRDQIDILVDLSGHFGNNHLLLFARKPAPVQVTFLSYPDTTGMSAMDYRLTDDLCDPLGVADRWHQERVWRLDRGPWYYDPGSDCPTVSPLPAAELGRITFCNLNNPIKTSPTTIETWARILQRVSNSRLMLYCPKGCQSYLEQQFAIHGIESEQLQWVLPRCRNEYLAAYQEVDIALDPFPFNGGITTCDALWMGVPVVTLAGLTCASRRGLAFLTHVQLPDGIAGSVSQYVDIACAYASDISKLQAMRMSLRQKMRISALGDIERFARSVESCYRQIWKTWCDAAAKQ